MSATCCRSTSPDGKVRRRRPERRPAPVTVRTLRFRWPVSMNRNARSRSSGISGHVEPEYPPASPSLPGNERMLRPSPEVLIPFGLIWIERAQDRVILARDEPLEHLAFRDPIAVRQSFKRKIDLAAHPHVQPAISVAFPACYWAPCPICCLPLCCCLCHLLPPLPGNRFMPERYPVTELTHNVG